MIGDREVDAEPARLVLLRLRQLDQFEVRDHGHAMIEGTLVVKQRIRCSEILVDHPPGRHPRVTVVRVDQIDTIDRRVDAGIRRSEASTIPEPDDRGEDEPELPFRAEIVAAFDVVIEFGADFHRQGAAARSAGLSDAPFSAWGSELWAKAASTKPTTRKIATTNTTRQTDFRTHRFVPFWGGCVGP